VYKGEKQSIGNRAVWMSIVFVPVDNVVSATTKYPRDKFCIFRTVTSSFTAMNRVVNMIVT
jgi:hypothetical protein